MAEDAEDFLMYRLTDCASLENCLLSSPAQLPVICLLFFFNSLCTQGAGE